MQDDTLNTGQSEPRRYQATPRRRPPAADIRPLSWAAEQLGIGQSTAYRLAEVGKLPGSFRVGRQWRISVPRFLREVHGEGSES